MIKVYRLLKRHIDDAKSDSSELNQIKVFSTCIGHGVGTIDFNEKILEIEDSSYEQMLENGDKYLKFKIGNLSKYSEIEIYPEHAAKLLITIIECPLKEILKDLKEGYLVLQKDSN